MRVLYVSHSLPPENRPMANVGGMQRVSLKLHEALQARSGERTAFKYEPLLLRSTWRWVHVKTPLFLARAAWRIAQAVRRDEVDVVLFSSMVTAPLSVPLRGLLRRHGVKTAAIAHGLDVTMSFAPYQWFVPSVFDALDAVLPVSRATKQACRDRGARPERLQVVPNGIDTERFRLPPDIHTARDTLGTALGTSVPAAPPDALLLCSVGRHVKRKGFHWFVEFVMPRLPDNVHYWIAGNGPHTDAVQRVIDRKGLHPRVQMLGRVSEENLAHLYRGADLFVMPNVPVAGDMEGFGVVLLEAAQCGTPAIASRLEGIQDVVSEGENGHLVEPESSQAFVNAIRMYYEDPGRLGPMSYRAAEYTTTHFGWSAVADAYLNVLRNLHEDEQPVLEEDAVPTDTELVPA